MVYMEDDDVIHTEVNKIPILTRFYSTSYIL